MGMSRSEFMDLTPREFWNALDGHYEKEQLREREHWERTRWQTFQLLSPHMSKGSDLKPKDLITFPWEEEDKVIEIPTDDDIKRIIERDKKILKCQS